jgi:hypothetical protein
MEDGWRELKEQRTTDEVFINHDRTTAAGRLREGRCYGQHHPATHDLFWLHFLHTDGRRATCNNGTLWNIRLPRLGQNVR